MEDGGMHLDLDRSCLVYFARLSVFQPVNGEPRGMLAASPAVDRAFSLLRRATVVTLKSLPRRAMLL